MTMKLISWNINGIRAAEGKGFFKWLQSSPAEIICVQETKAQPEQLTEKFLHPEGYHSFWNSAERKGYSGVAVFTRSEPLSVNHDLGFKEFDCEGRMLELEFKDYTLFNVYFPNGSSGNVRVPYKMAFYDAFLKHIEKLRKKGRRLVICGDVNTAHEPIDLARPKENEKNTGFLPEERAWVSKLISKGYVDTFRSRHPNEPGHYSWWDYKTKARERDVGWRIDYFFISNDLEPKLKSAFILKDMMGSDHCPVGIELDL